MRAELVPEPGGGRGPRRRAAGHRTIRPAVQKKGSFSRMEGELKEERMEGMK